DRSETGIALVVVLLLLALLLPIVAEFAQAMRLEAVATSNYRASIAETWLAQAAYQRALAEILPDSLAQELDLKGTLAFRRAQLSIVSAPEGLDVRVEPGRLSYRLTDESARLNLNRATRDVLDRLLLAMDVEKSTRDVIVDSILDWRDPNEEHRLNGAESDYYLALPVPYKSKNADFDSVDELVQVRGVTPELLYGRPGSPGLAEYVTVWGSGAINVNTVSPVVLRALGFSEAEADPLTGRRPYVDLNGLTPALRCGNQRTSSDVFRIEAWAGGTAPAGRVLTAVVQRRATNSGGIEAVPLMLRWSDAARPVTAAPPPSGRAELSPKS